MSTEFDLFCVDCDDGAGVESRRPDALGKLLTIRPALESLASLDLSCVTVDSPSLNRPRNPIPMEFFAKHAGHTLRVRSEYGEFEGDCNTEIRPSSIALICRLPRGHSEPCVFNPKWPARP